MRTTFLETLNYNPEEVNAQPLLPLWYYAVDSIYTIQFQISRMFFSAPISPTAPSRALKAPSSFRVYDTIRSGWGMLQLSSENGGAFFIRV